MQTENNLVDRLTESKVYSDYERAFSDATGLPLRLRSVESWQLPHHRQRKENDFCAMLASRGLVYAEDSFAASDPRFTGDGKSQAQPTQLLAVGHVKTKQGERGLTAGTLPKGTCVVGVSRTELSDERWRDADSMVLLASVVLMVAFAYFAGYGFNKSVAILSVAGAFDIDLKEGRIGVAGNYSFLGDTAKVEVEGVAEETLRDLSKLADVDAQILGVVVMLTVAACGGAPGDPGSPASSTARGTPSGRGSGRTTRSRSSPPTPCRSSRGICVHR